MVSFKRSKSKRRILRLSLMPWNQSSISCRNKCWNRTWPSSPRPESSRTKSFNCTRTSTSLGCEFNNARQKPRIGKIDTWSQSKLLLICSLWESYWNRSKATRDSSRWKLKDWKTRRFNSHRREWSTWLTWSRFTSSGSSSKTCTKKTLISITRSKGWKILPQTQSTRHSKARLARMH